MKKSFFVERKNPIFNQNYFLTELENLMNEIIEILSFQNVEFNFVNNIKMIMIEVKKIKEK